MRFGGADRDRTGDPLLAKQVLSQLSYSPTRPPRKANIAFGGPRCASAAKMVGLGRVELPTSPLSGVRSNQLSYRPNGWPATPPSNFPGGSNKTSFNKGVSRTRLNVLHGYAMQRPSCDGDQAKKACIRIPALTVRDGNCRVDGHSHSLHADPRQVASQGAVRNRGKNARAIVSLLERR